MDILAPDENLIKKLHPSRWYFWQFYFVGLLLIIISFLLPAFNPIIEITLENMKLPEIAGWLNVLLIIFGFSAIAIVELLRVIHIYYITDKRVIEEFVFLSRRVASCEHSQIQNINSVQGVTERIAGIGNLEFHTAGWGESNRPEICFRGVNEPMLLKTHIMEVKIKNEQKQ